MGLTRRRLLAGLGGAAAAGGGAAAGLWRWREGPELRALALRELPERRFDVCVIGSGPAGAVLAGDLARRGARVVLLESGYTLERAAELRFDPGQLDRYALAGDIPYPVQATRLRAVGGASNLWTGNCSRLHPIDFEPNAYTPPDNPWPLRYEDMAPWYERADQTLRVRGGPLSEHHPPREHMLPGDGAGAEQVAEAVAALGLTLDASPSSRAPRFRPGPVRAGRDLLPAVSQRPGVDVVTGATVVRLASEPGGTVGAAEVRSTDGAERSVRADVFAVCCGALESARLLLLSSAAHCPDGLGNRSGWLGRGFNEHPNVDFKAQLPFDTPGPGLARCHALYEEGKRAGHGSAIYVFATGRANRRHLRIGASVEMLPSAHNRLTLDPARRDAFGSPGLRLAFAWSPEDRATLAAARARIAGFYHELGARDVEERPLGWSHHHAGTCRMGDDPAHAVVDADLRVHGTANLHVVSSATFVTAGAAHPTLGIVALAHRLAERLGA